MDNFLILVLVCASVFVAWFQYQVLDKLLILQTENKRLGAKISKPEELSDTHPAVAVHVRLSGITPLTGTSRVMYDVEITNIGKAFNFQTGLFTAPVSGVYLFHVTMGLYAGGQWMDLDIMENDKVIGRVFSGDNAYHTSGTGTVSVHLNAGDVVWVQRVAGTATALNQDHGWNTFTAMLINAD